MYVDNTSLAHSAKDVKDITCTMNTELENLTVWLHVSKLSLSVARTTGICPRHVINHNITTEPWSQLSKCLLLLSIYGSH